MAPLGFGGKQATEWVQRIARGEWVGLSDNAIIALACEIVRLETLLRQVYPGLFADEDEAAPPLHEEPEIEPVPKLEAGLYGK